jgi:plasmid stability protein
MASITIRKLGDELKARLQARAAEHGLSMEEEARRILRDALAKNHPVSLGDLALALFGPKHGVDLELPPPVEPREPPKFD